MDSSVIEPPPKIGTRLNTDFIQGMGKRDEHFVIILDINKVFSAENPDEVNATMTEPEIMTA